MLTYKYVVVYKEVRSLTKKEAIKSLILIIFNDWRKLVLCGLFFIEQEWAILIVPIILQTLSLVVFVVCNNTKQRISKTLIITNECSTAIFWVFWVLFNSCFSSLNSISTVGAFILIVFLMAILIIENAVMIGKLT